MLEHKIKLLCSQKILCHGKLGNSFGDLKVDFKVSGKSYSGVVVPELSKSLGNNRYELAVKAPTSVPLGESKIVLSRSQLKNFASGAVGSEVVKLSSFEDLQLKPTFSDLILVAQRSNDKIRVIDALSPVATPLSQLQKPPKDFSVGKSGVSNRPGQLAVTNNGTRAYVPLERSGRVAMVDLLTRREVDADPSTPGIDDINLPSGASPGAISIDPWDDYAYISDSGRGSIYVLDVNPDSPSYNQVVQTLSVNATSGLRQIATSSDGRKLFATAADGYIYVVNIDAEDYPNQPNSNPRKWREQIGKVLTPNGAFGLAATPDPHKMAFTSGNPNTDGSGFGVLTVNDDPLNLSPTTRYTDLTLTNNDNFFEVNEGVAVTVTKDGKYAFVAGRNSKKILEPDANPLAGGNIGIIKDPLGPNPKLVAATEPVPGSLTNNVALSSDGKYLIGSYPGVSGIGSAYVFDVGEIIKTVENPVYALTTRAVEKINQNIIPKGAIPAVIAIGGNPLGLAIAPKPLNFKVEIEKLLKAGAIANYNRLIALIVKTNDQNDLRAVVGDVPMRKLIVDSFSSKPGMATAIMASLLKGSQWWTNPVNNDFVQHFERDKKTTPMPYNASMNCWEMILYAAFLCGQITTTQIRNFFEKSNYNFLKSSGMPMMGYKESLPFYVTLPNSQQKATIKSLQPGELLFYIKSERGDADHVAIALGGGKVVSLWDKPNNNNQIQILDVLTLADASSIQVGQPITDVMKGELWK